ncbi:LysE family translocator [Halodesulfovibrio aestuarii]|uniref:LysE family translocator n=1 Tax=Halodesulfovibrio aestuarii TaxID=126333 RepID=UPI003D32BAFB
MSIFASMFAFTFVGAVTPGPVNFIAASTGARGGYKKTVLYILGATISYTLVVVISGVCLGQVSQILPEITWFLKVVGGAFLLYVAYKIAMSKGFDLTHNADGDSLPGFWEGFLVQVLNPKAWFFAMSGVSLFALGRGEATLYFIVFSFASFILCFIGVSVWGVLGGYIGQFLSTPKRQTGFNHTMGTLLSVAVICMLVG